MVTAARGFDPRTLRRDYGDITAEARSARSGAALFDFSFMRRIVIRGAGAPALVQTLTPRPLIDLVPGRIRYALTLDREGNVRSDITVWRLDAETFEVFAGTSDAVADLLSAAGLAASVHDVSEDSAILAVQGPWSLHALAAIADTSIIKALPYFAHAETRIAGTACRIGRLGYTGERGFEIVLSQNSRGTLWAALAQHARPAGFAAADILRIEAGFPLFVNEFVFAALPSEVGLARFAATSVCGPTASRMHPIRLACFQADADADPILWQPRKNADFPPGPGSLLVTSACRSIVGKQILGLGYVRAAHAAPHLIDPTGEFCNIREVSRPFYDPYKRRPRGGWNDGLLPTQPGGTH